LVSPVSVAISGGLGRGFKEDTTLYLKTQESMGINNSFGVFLKTAEPTLSEDGNIITSGNVQFIISGNNDAGVFFKDRENTSLFIANRDVSNNSADLYLHRPEEFVSPLFVQSLIESDDINVYISGANIGSGDMSLYIQPLTATGVDLFTRGYLE